MHATLQSTPWRGIPVTLVIHCFGTITEDVLHKSYQYRTEIFSIVAGMAGARRNPNRGSRLARPRSVLPAEGRLIPATDESGVVGRR